MRNELEMLKILTSLCNARDFSLVPCKFGSQASMFRGDGRTEKTRKLINSKNISKLFSSLLRTQS